MKLITQVLTLTLILLSSCSGNSLDSYSEDKPIFNPKDFFQGKMVAKGMVSDRSGKVIKRFHCDIIGSWDGNKGILDETFKYADGGTQKRIWHLEYDPKTKKITGKASDIVGVATGEVRGNSFHFKYDLKIEVEGTEYEIFVDDWMHLIDQNTLMAKSNMSKWGFDVGEINLVMLKDTHE